MPSGLALARAVENALFLGPDANVLVLGNHGLVVAGDDCGSADRLLSEVETRLAIAPRLAPEPDYGALVQLSGGSAWNLPDEEEMHALGTDETARSILAGGLLYPCQAIFSNSTTPALFRSIPCSEAPCHRKCSDRPFLIVDEVGTLLGPSLMASENAMLRGLAEVVQRLGPSAPIRYLTESELERGLNLDAYRHRELANASGVDGFVRRSA